MENSNHPRPRVLVVAFACDPYVGSEPGAGWGVVRAISEYADLVVLVAPDHLPSIQRWSAANDQNAMTFVPVPIPRYTRFPQWMHVLNQKLLFVPYLAWLRSAKKTALRLEAEERFDASIHVAYGSYWLPSPVVDLEAPSVWGPVGGATATPRQLWRFLGWRGILGEWLKQGAVRLGTMLPGTRRTWRRATIRVAESENTKNAFPRELRGDTRVINRATLQEIPETIPPVKRSSSLLFPSRLQPRKGARLAISALARTPASVRLIFVSDGFDEKPLRRFARRNGVADRVEFRGRVPRDELFKLIAESAAIVFSGLREEGGCALSESMQVGAPVIVLGHGGARCIAEANTDPDRIAIIEPGTAEETVERMALAMTRFSTQPSLATGSYLDRESTAIALGRVLHDAMSARPSETASSRRRVPAKEPTCLHTKIAR